MRMNFEFRSSSTNDNSSANDTGAGAGAGAAALVLLTPLSPTTNMFCNMCHRPWYWREIHPNYGASR